MKNFNTFKKSGLRADALANWEKIYLVQNAAEYGNTDQIKYLVYSGIDVDMKTDDGYTALYTAAKLGRLYVVNFLLSLGANPVPKNNRGESVLDCLLKPEIRTALTNAENKRIRAVKKAIKKELMFNRPKSATAQSPQSQTKNTKQKAVAMPNCKASCKR